MFVTCRCTVCSLTTRRDGDLAIREAFGEQPQDLALPRGHAGQRAVVVGVACRSEAGQAGLRGGCLVPRVLAAAERDQARRQLEAGTRRLERRAAALVPVDGVLEERARAIVVASGRHEHALEQVGAGPQGQRAGDALDLPHRLEARRGLVEIPTRDLRPREHLERREPLQPSVLGQLTQEPLGELGSPRGIAAVEREAGAAELLGLEGAGPVEQRGGLCRPSLAPPQLRQPGERRRRPGRARGHVVLVRGGEHGLGLRPPAVPEVDGPVLAAAEGEHVAAPVALCELGDAVAPLAGPLEVEHRGAGADQQAARPGARDRNRRLVLECRRGGLVEVAHALGDLRRGDEHRALEREAEDLEVGDGEAPAELGGECREAARGVAVARGVREEPVVEREPAVIGAGLQARRAGDGRAGASRSRPLRRRRSRAGRRRSTWPSGRQPPRCPRRGRAGTRPRARRRPYPRRRATTPPS